MKETLFPMGRTTAALLAASTIGVDAVAQVNPDPTIGLWKRNVDATAGRSTEAAIHPTVSAVEADVQAVHFDATHAYIEATGIPSHNVGPFPGNPGVPDNQTAIFRFPLDPVEETGTKTSHGLGAIAVMLNGVPLFNASDGQSYNNGGVWNQSAIFFEGPGLDPSLGHPAMDQYHYHSRPLDLSEQLGENGVDHSPLLGFAFDGFPIYGAYGYDDPLGSGGVVRIESSWQLRNITARETLPDGTQLDPADFGPAIGDFPDLPLGAYIEDFEFVPGSGHLDEHNGRFCVTPEYPQGTYAYFSTLDANGDLAYPFVIGPTYYGVVDDANMGGGGPGGGGPGGGGGGGGGNGLSVPANATAYTPFTLYTHDFEVGRTATMALGDGTPGALVSVAVSLSGNGPLVTPLGQFSLSLPLRRTGVFVTDAAGRGSVAFDVTAALSGTTYYVQAVTIDAGAATLSNVNNVFIR